MTPATPFFPTFSRRFLMRTQTSLRNAWQARSVRERLFLAFLAMVLAAAGMGRFVWQPMLERRERLLNEWARIEQLDDLLRRVGPALAAKAPRNAEPTLPRPTLLAQTAKEYSLTIRRLEPDGDATKVTVEDAPFDALMQWFDALEGERGLRIRALTVERRPALGVVQAVVTIEG
jgi:general secretion pathway protein M